MPHPIRRGYLRGRQSIASAGNWTVNLQRPAEAVEGDLLIAHLCVGTGGFTVVAANGWQQLKYQNVNTRSIITFARRYDEDDPATYTITLNVSAAAGAEVSVMAIGNASDIASWTIGSLWRRQDNGGSQAVTQSPGIPVLGDSLVLGLEIEATNAIENDGSEIISGATKWFGSPDQTTASVSIERVLVSYIEVSTNITTSTITTTWPNAALNGAGFQVAIPYLESAPAPVEYVKDTFERTVASGSWGAAEVGGTYTSTGPSSYLSVNGGKGLITLPSGGSAARIQLNSISQDDVELYAEWSVDKIPTVSNVRPRFLSRYISGVGDYHVRLTITPTATVDYRWYRDDSAAIGSAALLTGTYVPGTVVKLRTQTYPDGAGVTRLRARMWWGTDAEPTTWPLNVIDSTAALQGKGAVGLSVGLGTGVDNVPIVTSFDNFIVQPRTPDATVATGNVTVRIVPYFSQTSLRVGGKFINSAVTNQVRLYNASAALLDTKTVTVGASKWANVQFDGLTPDTPYTIKFFVNGVEQTDSTMTIRTLPNAKSSFKIVAGSCQFTGSTHPIFTRIAEDQPLFIAHMGDLQYQDATDETSWRAAVESSLTSDTMRLMLGTVPFSWTWDNHDRIIVDTLNMGSTSPATSSAWREIAGDTGWTSSQTMGRSWTVGRVRFIQTDQWTVRDDPDLVAEPRTFLGAAQKQWWKDTLLAAEEPVIVWFCQWTAQNHANGRWNSFNAETTELENWLIAHPSVKERLILVGGDSHKLQADSGTRTRAQGSRFNGVPSLNVSGFNRSSTGANGGNWDIAEADIRLATDSESAWGAYSRMTFNDDGTTIDMLWEAVQVGPTGTPTVLASWRRKTGTVMIDGKTAIAQYYRSDQSRIQPLSIENLQ